MVESNKQFFTRAYRKESNAKLLRDARKLRQEKAHPEKYGKGGTSRWVTQTEFMGRSGVAALNREIARRKAKGLIRKSAGKSRRPVQQNLWAAFGRGY